MELLCGRTRFHPHSIRTICVVLRRVVYSVLHHVQVQVLRNVIISTNHFLCIIIFFVVSNVVCTHSRPREGTSGHFLDYPLCCTEEECKNKTSQRK
ncbi:hypothetical protein FR483_n730L [Paramecium bursaria Chlorella virus FR483]|uniref:Uncharacterized protein n730L n=1 Tax=Paramecium bursaria Chlorella virus FR483 TaxID=399781 RepID=A7J884_PBCVF|nr:hypothetical protein FR483_n730L [Paramecium bursaria Chlorella virus FR483]ABT16015.1 hypothetical protein FR483_n730L [Paramecium bursaria Chlorella virus FR483]